MFRRKVKRMPKGYDKSFKPTIISEELRKTLLDYHFFCAKEFYKGRKTLTELARSQKTKKDLLKVYNALKQVDHVRSLLDDHYHNLISSNEFNAWGHLWYSEDGKIHSRREDFKND